MRAVKHKQRIKELFGVDLTWIREVSRIGKRNISGKHDASE